MSYGYQDFSYYYDMLNGEADYDKLGKFIHKQFLEHGIHTGIIADLGCGTGELAIHFAKLGYDMLAVDASENMLSVLQQKISEEDIPTDILLLQQRLESLDLYGTINGAYSTFDTLNHIYPSTLFEKAIGQISTFLEVDGIFIFDINTLYKQKYILGDHTFSTTDEDFSFIWKNAWYEQEMATKISISIADEENHTTFAETFWEYVYLPEYVEKVLQDHKLEILSCIDGETFEPIHQTTQRYLYVTKRR